MKIKELLLNDRPREKLLRYGPERLEIKELLAIIIGTGTKGKNAIEVAKNLEKVLAKNSYRISFADLSAIPGIGQKKACTILAFMEIFQRLNNAEDKKYIYDANDIWYLSDSLKSSKKEQVVAFYLDSRNALIKQEVITVGTINSSLIHPREIFEPAIKLLASRLIIAHNHPSGDCEPSNEDIIMTKQILASSEILDIKLLDHIIISKKKFFSFKENDLLKL